MTFSLFLSTKFIGTASMFISNYHYLLILFNFPLTELKFPVEILYTSYQIRYTFIYAYFKTINSAVSSNQ